MFLKKQLKASLAKQVVGIVSYQNLIFATKISNCLYPFLHVPLKIVQCLRGFFGIIVIQSDRNPNYFKVTSGNDPEFYKP